MFYFSISPEEFIYKWGTHYHPIIKGDLEDMLFCCSCNTDVYVRIAWSLSAASVSMTCAWKIAAFLHKQLERLQALAELHGGVDAVITAVIIGLGLALFVCALMRAADCSDDSNSVKWVVLCVTKRVKKRL